MVVRAHPHSRFSPTAVEHQMMPSQVINVPFRNKVPTPTNMAARNLRTNPVLRSPIVHAGGMGGGGGPGDYRLSINDIPEKQSRVSNARSLETITKPEDHVISELECDYDTSATELYELLESSDWERARIRCLSHPEEVRTWIVRKDKSKQVRWKLLPLHAAIIFQAPSFVVSSLLERYPAAASRKDDQGMLPLHLAFRHKQEDEDLLELLLVQYPQAVMLRDRRDRIALEHGRESRYSAKLMRLYGEAMMSASVCGTPGSKHASASRGDTHTSHTDSLTHSHSVSQSQLARLEAEHESKLAVVKADYMYQIKTMESKYEDRIKAIQNKTSALIRETEIAASEQRQKIVEQHTEEVTELREMLTRQVNKDRTATDSLQKEVALLQNSLTEAQTQSEILNERYTQLVADNEQLGNFLDTICEDQVMIQDIASSQQRYLDAARSIRTELVQTLMKQEDADGENDRMRGSKLVELANSVQQRIHHFAENNLHNRPHAVVHHHEFDTKTNLEQHHSQQLHSPRHHSQQQIHRKNDYIESNNLSNQHRINGYDEKKNMETEEVAMIMTEPRKPEPRKGLSRIEVERGDEQGNIDDEGDDVIYSSDQQGQTEVQAFYVVQGDETGGLNGKQQQQQLPEKYGGEVDKEQSEEDYGEVRILGDEISAITENSAY